MCWVTRFTLNKDMRIYNTLTGKKEPFKPLRGKLVNFFVCGPTVYDSSHIGHARTYVFFDVAVKYLRMAGWKVFYLQNITDIDDKIINRANELGQEPLFLSRHYTSEYFKDMEELRINSVSKYAPASKFIPQIITQINTLIKKKYAYSTPGGVYFDITKFSQYGKLSHQSLKSLKKAVRIEPDLNKRHDFDFVLWKAKKPKEPFWPSPWGNGRPGWHIEDTAISEHFFGPQYSIHGGGVDFKFPHHESEIAQQESASGKTPFVKYWMHTGHLQVSGTKMSKSLKNFITIHDLLKKHTAEAFRLLILQNHYRSPLNYTDKSIQAAEEGVRRIREFYERLSKIPNPQSPIPNKSKMQNSNFQNDLLKKFNEAMEDDFDTPKVIAEIFNFIKKTNGLIDKNSVDKKTTVSILAVFKKIDSVLGIIPKTKQDKIPEKIKKLAEIRERYRKEKNWERADEARKKIAKTGFIIEDTPSGPIIKKAGA